LDADPFRQFTTWFAKVLEANVPEPNAMVVATSTRAGIPSARVVLLKQFDDRGFVFFTNHDSQKGRELSDNPQAALVFFWPTLERQVRISGAVSTVSREETAVYFHSRPVLSQIGAWASQQSQVLTDRAELERRVDELTKQFQGQVVPLPPHWTGFRVEPSAFEFWQGRHNRLHDRFVYHREATGGWKIERLYP